MSGNAAPIFSRVGDIQGATLLTTAEAQPYTGQAIQDIVLFTADATNGGFVQKIRFKSTGTNIATVARIYHNNGGFRLATTIAAPSTPTGTPSASGGTLQGGSFYAKIVAVDQYGGFTFPSTESALVTTAAGSANSIGWAWTALTGAVSYRVYTGPVPGGECTYFTTTSNAYTQTSAVGTRDTVGNIQNNNTLIGEASLPATAAIATAATVEIDYPLNIALPPGNRIIVGLGTTVAAGWFATAIGGAY